MKDTSKKFLNIHQSLSPISSSGANEAKSVLVSPTTSYSFSPKMVTLFLLCVDFFYISKISFQIKQAITEESLSMISHDHFNSYLLEWIYLTGNALIFQGLEEKQRLDKMLILFLVYLQLL